MKVEGLETDQLSVFIRTHTSKQGVIDADAQECIVSA